MRWLELTAQVESSQAEAVAEVFGRFGYGGVAIEEEAIRDSEDEVPFPNRKRRARIRIFLPIDNSLPKKRRELEEAFTCLALKNPIKLFPREIDEQEWGTAWRKHYKTLKVGRRLLIKPSWEDYKATADQVVVELDPGMAFGTGQHATTRLCLVALERYLCPGMAVLDLGTGSGILAIAAAKLGASSVLALDINTAAVEVAKSNVQANGLCHLVTVEQGTLPRDEATGRGSFDLVLANIVAGVIEELADSLVSSLKPQGILIVSGIVGGRLDGVIARLEEEGSRIIEVLAEGEWRTVVAQAKES